VERAESVRESDHLYGFWSMTAHPSVLDVAASVRPDFICLDTQHGTPLERLDPSTFTVLANYGVPSLVRVEALDETPIGRSLDMGADGVIIPMVSSVDDARRAVAASRLAPEGTRSFGVQTRRISPVGGASPVCWIQVETAGAMNDVEEIASIDGVDGLYVGPADLGLALVGEPAADVESVFDGTSPHAEEMMAAFERVVLACRDAGVAAGLHCGSGHAAAAAAQHGFTVSAVAADLGLIEKGLAAELVAVRPSRR
jgi:4-hydroxy-2-oxoheptanedioate aldolase